MDHLLSRENPIECSNSTFYPTVDLASARDVATAKAANYQKDWLFINFDFANLFCYNINTFLKKVREV